MSQTDDVWAKTLLKSDKRWADQIDSDDEQTDMSAGHQGDLEDLNVVVWCFADVDVKDHAAWVCIFLIFESFQI